MRLSELCRNLLGLAGSVCVCISPVGPSRCWGGRAASQPVYLISQCARGTARAFFLPLRSPCRCLSILPQTCSLSPLCSLPPSFYKLVSFLNSPLQWELSSRGPTQECPPSLFVRWGGACCATGSQARILQVSISATHVERGPAT